MNSKINEKLLRDEENVTRCLKNMLTQKHKVA